MKTQKHTTTPAIITLEIALETLETNEPINRREGNIEQADLEAKNAPIFRKAIAILKAHHDHEPV